jgi:hypothetical protein
MLFSPAPCQFAIYAISCLWQHNSFLAFHRRATRRPSSFSSMLLLRLHVLNCFSIQVSITYYIHCTLQSESCLRWVRYERRTDMHKGKGGLAWQGIHVKTTPMFSDPSPALASSKDLAAHPSTQRQYGLRRVSIRWFPAAWRHRRRLLRGLAGC